MKSDSDGRCVFLVLYALVVTLVLAFVTAGCDSPTAPSKSTTIGGVPLSQLPPPPKATDTPLGGHTESLLFPDLSVRAYLQAFDGHTGVPLEHANFILWSRPYTSGPNGMTTVYVPSTHASGVLTYCASGYLCGEKDFPAGPEDAEIIYPFYFYKVLITRCTNGTVEIPCQ